MCGRSGRTGRGLLETRLKIAPCRVLSTLVSEMGLGDERLQKVSAEKVQVRSEIVKGSC